MTRIRLTRVPPPPSGYPRTQLDAEEELNRNERKKANEINRNSDQITRSGDQKIPIRFLPPFRPIAGLS